MEETKFENVYEDFFKSNKLINCSTKKGIFLLGVLAQKLLTIQYMERRSKPFRSRLNGLRIDEKKVKRLLPEIINKLEEYDKNYYRKLEEAISSYMLQAEFGKFTVDEMSFYFTLGMNLADNFEKRKEKDAGIAEEIEEVEKEELD